VSAVEFLQQPARMILDAPAGPAFVKRCFVVVTLAAQGIASLPTSISWRPSSVTAPFGEGIVLDFESHRELEIRRAVAAKAPAVVLAWEGPFRSPGSTTDGRRATLLGHFAADLSDLDLRLAIMSLRALPQLAGVLAGRRGLFADPGSRLLDFRSAETLGEITDLADEVVLASPRLAVVRTLSTQAEWTARLTAIAAGDADEAIEALRTRPSAGGRPWAKPACRLATLPQWLAAGAGAVPGAAVVLLRVRGPFGPHPCEALGALMRRAAERVSMAWTELPADGPIAQSEWHQRFDHRGVVSGRIAFGLGSDEEMRMVESALSDAVVNFTGVPTLLTVEALPGKLGNGRVGRGVPTRG